MLDERRTCPLDQPICRVLSNAGELSSAPSDCSSWMKEGCAQSPYVSETLKPKSLKPRVVLQGRRGGARKKASASEEREFRRRAAALKIRISPYFNRRRGAADAE